MSKKLIKKLTKWNKIILEKEKKLTITYGLRNKLELQRVYFKLSKIKKTKFDQISIVKDKLIRLGILSEDESLLDVTIEKILNRRTQTIISGLCKKSLKHSRQLITHGHVKLNDIRIKSPSQLLTLEQEKQIIILINND